MRALLTLTFIICCGARAGAAEPTVGDVLYAPPGGFPFPGTGLPLADTAKGAQRVARTFEERDNFPKLGKLSETEGWPYLRAGTKVKVTGKADGGALPVEVVTGAHKGAKGFVAPDMMAPKLAPPGKPSERPEAVRKKVYARYFELLTESFQESRKANPGAKLWDTELAARASLGKKMDREGKALGVPADEWAPIIIQGLIDGWDASWSEK